MNVCPEKRGKRTELGVHNDTLPLDSDYLKHWVCIWMAELAQGGEGLPAFDFDYPDFLREVKRTGREFGLRASSMSLARCERGARLAEMWL